MKIPGAIVIVVATQFSALSAWSQEEGLDAKIDDLTNKISTVVNLIEGYRIEIEALEEKIATLTVSPSAKDLPEDAILLSSSACEKFGWKTLQESLGRMPVGAGSIETEHPEDRYMFNHNPDGSLSDKEIRPYRGKHYQPMETGGAETHKLTGAQVPPHIHGLELTKKSHKFDQYGANFIRFNVTTGGRTAATTSDNKATQPHNNMPPYIALYFCQNGEKNQKDKKEG